MQIIDSFGEMLTEAQVSGDTDHRCGGKCFMGEVPECGRKLTFLSGVREIVRVGEILLPPEQEQHR